MAPPPVTLQSVFSAQKAIRPFCSQTPVVESPKISSILGGKVYLKLESMQEIRSFKVRGAANRILNLTTEERERGVVTASTGNHGRAVAFVAKKIGIHATICMSEAVPANKVSAIESLGAEVAIFGSSQDDAFVKAMEIQEKDGRTLIEPFDDPYIIAGQGTIGLELISVLPELDIVLVPLSGGGLISGVAFALKSINPAIRVIGVSMERAPIMYHSLKAGKPVQMAEEDTLADSLRGGIGLENKYTFQMVKNFVDDVVLVSEAEIASAMAFALQEHQLVVEGAGAVGIAALLNKKARADGKNAAVVISGSNVEIPWFLKTIQPHIG